MRANIERKSQVMGEKGIATAEEHYKATFIGDFDLMDINMDFTFPVAVFYNENPPEKTAAGNPCSNYLGIYYHPFNKNVYVMNAEKVLNEEVKGFIDKDGYYRYSTHGHDFKSIETDSGEFYLDGGFRYFRSNAPPSMVRTAKINKDHLEIEENT